MSRAIRLQSDSNAHDRPWRVAVEQGFFAAEGLSVEYHEDNPKGTAGRVENVSQRWKEPQLRCPAKRAVLSALFSSPSTGSEPFTGTTRLKS